MHTMINAMEDVPCLIKFSSAATHDHTFLKELELKKGSYVVFDKGYVDYVQYQQWTLDDIYFVTRQKDNARYTSLEEFDIPDKVDEAVLKDEKIELLDKNDNPFTLGELLSGMINTKRFMSSSQTTLILMRVKSLTSTKTGGRLKQCSNVSSRTSL